MTEKEPALGRLIAGSFVLVILLLGSVLVAEEQPLAADDWLGWASTAWKYFSPSTSGGVHPTTGLNRANQYWGFLTDWDLATYTIAILHARDLGLILDTGSWGASSRLDKVLRYLEQRPLRPSDGLPYWCYKWDKMDPYEPGGSGGPGDYSHPGDAGRLLVSLYLVKQAYPSRAIQVDAIVDRVRAAYVANYYDSEGRLIVSNDWYRYYDLFGFESFGFPVEASRQVLEEALARPHVDVYGQSLAPILTTAEPFLLGLFELQMDSRFQEYAYRTYRAMEERYNNLGILTSWSECAYDKDPYYIYEMVVKATGETWQLHPPTDSEGNPYTPVVTSKGVFGYHALYHTSYTQLLLNKVLPKIHTSNLGFTEGAYEATGGNVGSGLVVATDKTNSLIISAARYATMHRTVTFYTDPTSATIAADAVFLGVVKTSGQNEIYVKGDRVHVVTSPPAEYVFSNWETSGLTVDDPSVADTYMTVVDNGWLKAHFDSTFDFSLSSSGGIAVTRGGSSFNTITATLVTDPSQSISLSCSSGLPTGASCGFNPETGYPSFSSRLTVTTSTSTPTGMFAITVAGVGGGKSRTTQFTLTIEAPPPSFDFALSNSGDITVTQGESGSDTVTTTLLSGTSEPVSLSCTSGLPDGASCAFNPESGYPTFTSDLTVTTSPSTAPGTYQVTVSGINGGFARTTEFALTVNPPPSFDFTLSNSGDITLIQGESGSNVITTTLVSGSPEPVSLSCTSGLPDGASCTFNPQSSNPTFESDLTVTTSPSTPPGGYQVTVTGTDGGLTRTTEFTLTVNAQTLDGLEVSIRRPSDGAFIRCPVKLVVKISASHTVVFGATVKFYVDGSLLTSLTTDIKGKAKYKFCPTFGTHAWYVTAEKTGYNPGRSGTRTFNVLAWLSLSGETDETDSQNGFPVDTGYTQSTAAVVLSRTHVASIQATTTRFRIPPDPIGFSSGRRGPSIDRSSYLLDLPAKRTTITQDPQQIAR